MDEQLLRDHAYIIAQATAAMIEAMGMQAANNQHPNDQPYSVDDFKALNDTYGLYHNAVMSTFFPR